MTTTLRTEAFRRGVLTNVSSGSFAISSNGMMTQATLDGLAIPKLSNSAVAVDANPFRALRAAFFGTAADNTVHNWRAYGAWMVDGRTVDDITYWVGCLAYGTFTLGSAVGLDDGGAVKTTERLADTITASAAVAGGAPAGPGDFFTQYMNGAGVKVYSPIDNTMALLGLCDLGNPAYILMDLQAASGTINALLARDL